MDGQNDRLKQPRFATLGCMYQSFRETLQLLPGLSAETAKLSLSLPTTVGALIITHTILGVPYYNKYTILGAKSPSLIIGGFPRMVKNEHDNIREMICIGRRLRDMA